MNNISNNTENNTSYTRSNFLTLSTKQDQARQAVVRRHVTQQVAACLTGEATSTNMFNNQVVKQLAWVVGEVVSRGIKLVSPITHLSYDS